MSSFDKLPNVFETAKEQPAAEEQAGFSLPRASKDENSTLISAKVRVFGKPGVPVMADLETRTVYPVKG